MIDLQDCCEKFFIRLGESNYYLAVAVGHSLGKIAQVISVADREKAETLVLDLRYRRCHGLSAIYLGSEWISMMRIVVHFGGLEVLNCP